MSTPSAAQFNLGAGTILKLVWLDLFAGFCGARDQSSNGSGLCMIAESSSDLQQSVLCATFQLVFVSRGEERDKLVAVRFWVLGLNGVYDLVISSRVCYLRLRGLGIEV